MDGRESESEIAAWIELPPDVWALIGSHLGARDLARASTVIKVLGGVQPLALNLAHTLTEVSKIGELVWGLKRSGRVMSAVIGLRSLQNRLFEMCPMVLQQTWSVSCIQELSLDTRSCDFCVPVWVSNAKTSHTANANGRFLLAQMPQLQLLALKAYVLLPLLIMPRLRHLSIKLYGWGNFAFCPAMENIAALPALQTLYAEVDISSAYYRRVAKMDLRTCVSLEAVCVLGTIPTEIMLPPAAKLTTDADFRHFCFFHVMAHGLQLIGHAQLWDTMPEWNFRMLSALSLLDVKDSGANVVGIHLGDNARQLRFLLVTCGSKNLHLRLSLPCLSTLIVHAAVKLELKFDKLKDDASRFEAVFIRWKVSSTVQTFEEALRAHCRKEIFAGVLGDPKRPELVPHRFVRTGDFGMLSHVHPCTVASGACGACLEHCCPLRYPVPEP